MTDPKPTLDFRTKICGVLRLEDIEACVRAGADCVGLNFYPKSSRYLEPTSPHAQQINEEAKQSGCSRVGLFVNHRESDIVRTFEGLALDAVQLHGDETPEMGLRLINRSIPIIRAIRLPTCQLAPAEIDDRLAAWQLPGVTFLLDADAGAAFGGGGKRLHWPSIAHWQRARQSRRQIDLQQGRADGPNPGSDFILAGGLDPECVAEAKRQSGASRVDVASGVESPRGTKSAELIRKFVQNSRHGGVDAAG